MSKSLTIQSSAGEMGEFLPFLLIVGLEPWFEGGEGGLGVGFVRWIRPEMEV